MDQFDIVVVGSGPGGYRAAVLAALRGSRVAIVEKGQWGGCCLNRGCVPKKAWHDIANLIAAAGAMSGHGVRGSLQADLAAAWEHQRQVTATVRRSYLDYLERLGIRAIEAAASLRDARTVDLDGAHGRQAIAARYVILATGSTPQVPPGMPVAPGVVLTTDALFERPPPPGRRVALVGAGVVGAEFAYILSLLGCCVEWIVSRAPLAASGYSKPARALLEEALNAYGIAPRLAGRVTAVVAAATGVTIRTQDGSTHTADWVLLGTGRRPYVDGLGLEHAGIERDARGFIRTDEQLRTNLPNVYAIGDCISAYMTANQAMADAVVAVDNILAGKARPRERLWVPEVVYSAVELARIGHSEDSAEGAGLEAAVGFSSFQSSPCALGQGDPRGFVRVLADLDSGVLLGGEVVGRQAGELIHLLSGAGTSAEALRRLARMPVNHPARAEEFVNAAETLARQWGLSEHVFGP